MSIYSMAKNIHKNCCVRLPADLHRRAKLQAYKFGMTLQEYIIALIEHDLRLTDHGQKTEFLLTVPADIVERLDDG